MLPALHKAPGKQELSGSRKQIPGQDCLGRGRQGDEEQGTAAPWGSGGAVRAGITGKEVLPGAGPELLLQGRSHLQMRLWELCAPGSLGIPGNPGWSGQCRCACGRGRGLSCAALSLESWSIPVLFQPGVPGGGVGGTCCPLIPSCLRRERGWAGTDPAALPGEGLGGQPLPAGHRAGEWLPPGTRG